MKSTIQASDYNLYSTQSTAIKVQELDNLKTVIQEKEAIKKKEEEIKLQAETLEKATAIEQQLKNNLTQAQDSLGDDSPLAKWGKMAPDKRSKEDYAINVPQWLKK